MGKPRSIGSPPALKKPRMTPSKESLHKAFIFLANSEPYEEIGVSSLCREAGVARTTFYSYYRNSDELLREIEDLVLYELRQVGEKSVKKGDRQYIKDVFGYVESRHRMLYLLLVKRPDYRLVDKLSFGIKESVYPLVASRVKDSNIGLALEVFSSMVISIYRYCLEHPNEVDIASLSEAMERILIEIGAI